MAFFVAAAEGAQLTIDGKQLADVHGVKPGLEEPVPVQLTEGWHDLEVLAYATSGPAELVLSFTPPGGSKQPISPRLLRAESTALTALTDAEGNSPSPHRLGSIRSRRLPFYGLPPGCFPVRRPRPEVAWRV